MKRKLLINIFFILLTPTLFANSFIGDISLSQNSISFNQLKLNVVNHSLFPGNYLSLGESHLYPITSRAVLGNLGKTFLKANRLHKKFCSEKISSFLNSNAGLEMKRLAHVIDIYEGNSPYRTNFKKCDSGKIELALTYSGFFHQHPFARPFPHDFKPLPVITDPINNIRHQLKDLNGMFITLMELDYLELTTSTYILNLKIKDMKRFKKIVSYYILKFSLLRQRMETIERGTTLWRIKKGVILEQNHFTKSNVLPKNSYIILTDLKSRFKNRPLKMLSDLVKLSDEVLQQYLIFMAEERMFLNQSFTEPADDGTVATMGYGTYNLQFPGGSTFLELIHSSRKSILVVSSPHSESISCYTKNNGEVIILDCNTLF
ncbi:MAG: hypothetical protein HN576_09420 [Bacteriovoracaceae bacterium]|jgi:hypothetical protein|nr:hypothetical protein [Bacteriovoracaceae bacterium]